jgi:pilus assembly protein CpaB
VLIVLAAVAGFSAFLLVRGYARRVEALAPALGPIRPVVVAAEDVPRGAVLDEDALDVRRVPAPYVPPQAVDHPGALVGRVALGPIAAGEAVTWTRVAPARAGPVAALVPTGYRAFAVASTLPRGALRAGDRIAVLGTFAGGHPHTETVVESTQILAVLGRGGGGGGSEGFGGGSETLLLLVTADDAERLAYARAFADLVVTVEPADPVVPADG